jgi:hypothetical protein
MLSARFDAHLVMPLMAKVGCRPRLRCFKADCVIIEGFCATRSWVSNVGKLAHKVTCANLPPALLVKHLVSSEHSARFKNRLQPMIG